MGTIDIIYKKDSEALLWGVPGPQKEIRTSLLPSFHSEGKPSLFFRAACWEHSGRGGGKLDILS